MIMIEMTASAELDKLLNSIGLTNWMLYMETLR